MKYELVKEFYPDYLENTNYYPINFFLIKLKLKKVDFGL